MELGLRGRVALVCAASQGLGKAAAIGFATEGAHTVVCARGKKALLVATTVKRYGRIINITSLTAKQPVNDLVISSTVRPGVLGLSKILANQYGKSGITFNNVAPGYMLTARQEEITLSRARSKGMSVARYREELANE